MKLRMRDRWIPAFSAAAAEYSTNPSCEGPCESVARTILDVVEKEGGDLRQLTTEVRLCESATVVVTVFSKDYG